MTTRTTDATQPIPFADRELPDTPAGIAAIPGVRTATALAGERETAAADGSTLPVAEPLAALGGLRRGTTVSVTDSTSLLLALLAAPTATGSWAACQPGL